MNPNKPVNLCVCKVCCDRRAFWLAQGIWTYAYRSGLLKIECCDVRDTPPEVVLRMAKLLCDAADGYAIVRGGG